LLLAPIRNKPVVVSAPKFKLGAPTAPAAREVTPLALNVVNAPVVAVVAPTVPLMLIEAVPVKLVTVPLAGVPNTGATRVNAVPLVVAPVIPPNAPALLY
jgi:hypothetical protein